MSRGGSLAMATAQPLARADHVGGQGRYAEDTRAAALVQFFERNGTLVRLNPHQQITPDSNLAPCSFLVRTGTIALEAALSRRHIVGFWHSSDLLTAAHLTPLPRLSIRAVRSAELWRVREQAATLPDAPTDVLHDYLHLSARMLRRIMLAGTMLACLTAEQRVVSFLVSCALRLGQRTANRADVDMPLARADIADHLGLNPDTLSRTMTRLQELGLVEIIGRRRLLVRDWAGLCAHTPLAPELLG